VKRAVFPVALLLGFAAGAAPPAALKIERPEKGKTVRVVGLDEANLKALAAVRWDASRWSALFAVYLDADGAGPATGDQPPMLGGYRAEDGVLHFEPRFPFAPGSRYRAVLNPSRLPQPRQQPPLTFRFADARARKTPTVVTQVYPTADKLPENQLKFYIHFSAPMARGNAYTHIKLLGPTPGKEVAFPFLELGEELWNPDGTRFTLFFDPGRIKRGLKSREEAGPALEEGKKYTLVIDSAWKDADDAPLRVGYRKTFTVTAPHDICPDPKKWKLEVPVAGTTKPLGVRFPGPLDHALLQRMLWVKGHGGKVAGTVTVAAGETLWQLTPAAAWQAGTYHLEADTRLEDLAGNSIGRPFEVDVLRPVEREVKRQTVRIPFTVAARR
jgi:hypothetical protein